MKPPRAMNLSLPLEIAGEGAPAAPAGKPTAAPAAPASAASSGSPAALESAFVRLLGRNPAPNEMAELYRVRDALQLRDNDALWLVLLSLHHYRGEIEQAVYRSLEHVRASAKATVEEAGTVYLHHLFPKLLAKATARITAKALGFNGSVVIAGVIALVTLVILGMGGASMLAYRQGERAGQQQCGAGQDAPPKPAPPTNPKTRGR